MDAPITTSKPVASVFTASSPAKALDLNVADAHKALGDGPMRYALIAERSIATQIAVLDPIERECFDNIKKTWEDKNPDSPFSDEMYLRFARCSPGKKKFNEKTALRVMKNFDKRYLSLTAVELEKQLVTKVSDGGVASFIRR